MSEPIELSGAASGEASDPANYCRQVEQYLTRANGGHLVRIVGPAFSLVRQWAERGIPLRIVFRGIDMKVERHRAGKARRPLRVEFCEGDVEAVYEQWRRAVGVSATVTDEAPAGAEPGEAADAGKPDRRKPSLARHLDRALERLLRTGGRLDLPDRLRDGIGEIATAVAEARDESRAARGGDRAGLAERLAALDREIVALARAAAADDLVALARRDAHADLAAYRGRLTSEKWAEAVDATVDQWLRDRMGLPTLQI